jgi:hypothetical protein
MAALLALVASLALGAPARTLSDPRAIPADAGMVFSVPDLAGAWKALAASPIYQDTVTFLDTPAVTALPAYRRFLDRRKEMETELGYPLNAATLMEIIAGFDYVSLPPTPRGPAASVCLFRVADPTRFRRIVGLIERRMGDAATSRTKASAAGTSAAVQTAVRTEYEGVKIVSAQTSSGLSIAEISPERFAMGNHAEAIRRLIDQCWKGEGLTSFSGFRSAVGGLQEQQPHGFLYFNSARSDSSQRGRLPALPLSSLVRGVRDPIVMAADFRIESGAVRFESFLPFADPAKDRLAATYRRYPPAVLRSLDYVSSSPVMVVAWNTLDGPALYEQMRGIVLAMLQAVVPVGQTPEQRLKLSEENLRDQVGFSLQDDLAPAIGPEVFVSLEQMNFDPLLALPLTDVVAGVQVRDSARMNKVVAGFENFFNRRARDAATSPTKPASLQTGAYQGKTVKWFAVPREPQVTIGYARTDSFTLIGLGGESIKHALDRIEGRRKAFSAGALHARLQPYLHSQANEILVLNVPKMAAVGREIASRLARSVSTRSEATKRAESLLSRIGKIEALAATMAGSQSGLQTRGALVFKTAPEPKNRPSK